MHFKTRARKTIVKMISMRIDNRQKIELAGNICNKIANYSLSLFIHIYVGLITVDLWRCVNFKNF